MPEVAFDWSTANEGSQLPFIKDTFNRHTSFVGGLGSGKSWSGAVKAVLYAIQHPGSLGLVCAPTYRQMRDSTLREFFKVLPRELIKSYNKSEYELVLINGSEVLFRSLENYENVRGVEAAWLWIDEAALCSFKAWRVAVGRLRQPGYPHRSWTTTTPRGKTGNWFYEEYVKKPGADTALKRAIYHARTRDNIRNVGEEYILDLEATYTGEFALQELEGQFIDIIEGRVYPEFSREHHVGFLGEPIEYNPALPTYGLWDYGIGDAGALWVAQIAPVGSRMTIPYKDPEDPDGEMVERPVGPGRALLLVDVIIEEGENVDYWIDTVRMIEKDWGPFTGHWGDPAGEQRTATTGKSMAQHLREAGIYVRSKKVPNDEGRNIVHRMLTQRSLFVSSDCEVGIASFTNFHWPLDKDGKRKAGSTKPEHDWSSHPMDAVRYGAVGLFPVLSASTFDERNLNQSKRGGGSRAPRSRFAGIKKREW